MKKIGRFSLTHCLGVDGMTSIAAIQPEMLPDGRIPTLNNRGFTTAAIDPLSRQFIDFASQSDGKVLDIGCAYGLVAKEVLKGGGRICASDIDPRHLSVLQETIEPTFRSRLRCVPVTLPDGDFPESTFSDILCSRVLHFLDGDQIDQALGNMGRWLRTGGKLFVAVDSPYSGTTRDRVVPIYEKNRSENRRWPGFIPDFETILPPEAGVRFETSFIHFMDPEILSEACTRAGLSVESVGYMARVANLARADSLGRDHVVAVMARG